LIFFSGKPCPVSSRVTKTCRFFFCFQIHPEPDAVVDGGEMKYPDLPWAAHRIEIISLLAKASNNVSTRLQSMATFEGVDSKVASPFSSQQITS
jgi:hypothetical protein